MGMPLRRPEFRLSSVIARQSGRANKSVVVNITDHAGAAAVNMAIAHGYRTGQLVRFATGTYAGAWVITVIDALSYTLDGSTYSGDNNAPVQPPDVDPHAILTVTDDGSGNALFTASVKGIATLMVEGDTISVSGCSNAAYNLQSNLTAFNVGSGSNDGFLVKQGGFPFAFAGASTGGTWSQP